MLCMFSCMCGHPLEGGQPTRGLSFKENLYFLSQKPSAIKSYSSIGGGSSPPQHTHNALLHAGMLSASIFCTTGTAVSSWVQQSRHLQKTLFLPHTVLLTSGVYCLSSLSFEMVPVLWDDTYTVTMTKSWTFDFCFIILALYCVVIEMLKKSLGHFMREELLPHPKAQKSWMYCIYIYTN